MRCNWMSVKLNNLTHSSHFTSTVTTVGGKWEVANVRGGRAVKQGTPFLGNSYFGLLPCLFFQCCSPPRVFLTCVKCAFNKVSRILVILLWIHEVLPTRSYSLSLRRQTVYQKVIFRCPYSSSEPVIVTLNISWICATTVTASYRSVHRLTLHGMESRPHYTYPP